LVPEKKEQPRKPQPRSSIPSWMKSVHELAAAEDRQGNRKTRREIVRQSLRLSLATLKIDPLEKEKSGRWAKICPFLKFLKKPSDLWQGDEERDGHRDFGVSRVLGDCQEMQPTEMHAKTAGMMGSLQSWLHSGSIKTPKAQDRPGGLMADEKDKAEKADWRTLISLSKKYNVPMSEARDMSQEFKDHDVDGTGYISVQQFHSFIRKRANLPEGKEIPDHLVKPIRKGQGRINFEDFLRWSFLTAWTEEMMQPCPSERHLRQLAREQDMTLPDVEKVKQLFNEFDTDCSGEIDEDEFRLILYKVLRVRDVTDVPLKRLQRLWREVDVDKDGLVNFNEFLVWYSHEALR